MNKKAVLIIVLLTVVSALFAVEASSIIGTWKYEDKEEGVQYSKTFTKDGYYVFEEEGEYGDYYEFGKFTLENDVLETDYTYFDLSYDKKYLYIDEVKYKRSSTKATNNSAKIAGVWTNDYYVLGLAKDGLAISMGSYMNIGDYTIADNQITIDDETSNYIVVNDCLYIEDFDFFHEYYTIKLKKQASSTGVNQTTKTNLVKQPWEFSNPDSIDDSVTKYTFKSNGNFTGERTLNGKKTEDFKGTYTMDGSRINLSNGTFIAFAIIDGTPIGYSIN